jgi:hypothetical protein
VTRRPQGQVASAANRDLWLAWIDALIAFEGSLGRSALLGCYWDVSDAGDMPVVLLQGSTLSVLGENHHWMVGTDMGQGLAQLRQHQEMSQLCTLAALWGQGLLLADACCRLASMLLLAFCSCACFQTGFAYHCAAHLYPIAF